jgi:monoamine oxidase
LSANSVREENERWIATISKIDGSMLVVTLPQSTGPRLSLDTTLPTYSREAAIQLAIDAINGGQVK